MIPFDFDYRKPSSAQEAVSLYFALKAQGKQPVYYAGGTELITMGRLSKCYTDAVIDIKGIAECRMLQMNGHQLAIGAAVTLGELQQSPLFPLLAQTASEISDHTARNKITIGGNVCGGIYYREASLPLLVTDTDVVIEGRQGRRQAPLRTVFHERPQLSEGELIVQFMTESHDLALPYFTEKKRRQWQTGYPLITIAAVKKGRHIRVSFSGVCPFPFRDEGIETLLNDRQLKAGLRVDRALRQLPSPLLDDVEGSPEYRLFVLRNTLLDMLDVLEGDAYGHNGTDLGH